MMENPAALERTVRDVIAHQPALVNEVWCRRIFRHILLALDRRHALHLPHPPISPDTVGFDAAGGAILLPVEAGGDEPGEAADVQALGALVHYAITGEPQPRALLRGRAPGYSESLVSAVDKCISPDPGARPQSIDELRKLLGIVAPGPAVAAAAPRYMPQVPPAARGRTNRAFDWQRWLLAGLACIVLLAAAAAFLMLLRGTDARENVVLTLPQPVPPAKTLDRGETLVQPQAHAPPRPPAAPATAPAPAPTSLPSAAPAPEHPAATQPARPVPARPARSTTYKLMIKPWGTVYVDGAERGVSPPLKKLALPAGRHTVRIANPNFRDQVIRVEAGTQASGRIDVNFAARSR